MARRLISEEPAAALLADNSMRWLTQALDPFPDYEQPPASWPDIDGSASIVQVVKGTFTVQKPSGLTAGATWDAHFFNLPDLRTSAGGDTAHLNAQFTTEKNSLFTDRGDVVNPPSAWLNCNTAPSGSPTLPVPTGMDDLVGVNFHPVSVDAYLNGPMRVVAAGYEVRNTTAPLNKQGTVTVYSMPQTAVDETFSLNSPTPFSPFVQFSTFKLPPAHVEDAMLLFGSRQWEAAEGVYVPITFSQTNNPLTAGRYAYTLYKGDDSDVENNYGFGTIPLDNSAAADVAMDPARIVPTNTHGAFFTGLSYETTLVCTWKLYLERAPGFRLKELAPLAFKQGSFDPDAFKLYSALVNKLPPACKAGDNDAGDWFAAIMGKVADLAPVLAPAVSTAFGIPPSVGSHLADALAPRIRNIGKAVQSRAKERAAKRKAPPGATPAPNTFIPPGKTAAPTKKAVKPRAVGLSRARIKRNIAKKMP